jgi:hypothetical protein
VTTTVPAIPVVPIVVAVDSTLVVDLTPCCPWCFEDAGSRWCRCDPIAETVRAEANRLGAPR